MNEENAPLITVFGSSRSIPDDPDYKEGVRLGALLAGRGFRVCTGGYEGLMAAVSQGAYEMGSSPIGITFADFGDQCNRFVQDHRRCPDLFSRLEHLVLEADGYVVMRGGMGTLAELMLVWIHIESGLRNPAPVVLLGHAWKTIIENLQEQLTISSADLSLLSFASTAEEAVTQIVTAHEKQPIK